MLPVKEIAEYARTFAANQRIQDIEEAEAVAVHSLAYSYEEAKGTETPMAYMKVFARNKIRQHFFNRKVPCHMPNDYDAEYNDEDRVANIIEGMDLTPSEEKIIKLRIEGYTDPEIANIIGKSRQLITKTRAILKKKFHDLAFLY